MKIIRTIALLAFILSPAVASAQWQTTHPGTNYWNAEFHSQTYGVPTAPANSIPKATNVSGALTGTIANASKTLTLSTSPPAGLAVGNWVAIGGKTATDNPGSACGTNWIATAGAGSGGKYASGCHTTTQGSQHDNGPTIPSGGSKGFSGVLVTPQGTTGATTVNYQICVIDGAGGIGECTTTSNTTTANATQTWTNDNVLTWQWNQTDEPEAEVCRSFDGGTTYQPIGVALHSSFRDIGQVAITNDPDLPNCPGGTVTATQRRPEHLYAQITAINGSTLTLSAAAQDGACSAGGCPVWSDDTPAIQAAINAAEAANVAMAAGGNETNSNQGAVIDSGQYTDGGQIITGENFNSLVIRGYGATILSQNISGPAMVMDGSGCDFNTTSGYSDDCNRTARAWLLGLKFVGEGANSSNYPDEYALYIGGNNGTYITDDTYNNFMGTWQGCISGNASGLRDDEHEVSGAGTSWTHVYFTDNRMNACGGPWVQIGDITAVDDPEFINFFFKNSGQATGSNPVGPQSGALFLGAFNPALVYNRYQRASNAAYQIHIANAQQGGMYSDYMQTPQSITTAMIVLDGTVGFGVDRTDISIASAAGADGIDLINSAAGSVITAPVFFNSGSLSQLTNGVNFSADGSATTGNYLLSYQTTGNGLTPITPYTNLGTTNFVLPDSTNSVPRDIVFKFDGSVTNSENRWGVCPATLRYGPGFQAAAGVTKPQVYTSQGIAGTAPSTLDTYSLLDAGTTIGKAYLGTGGTAQFGSPGCSPAPDGNAATQGTSITSLAVSPTLGAATDDVILNCAGANTTNTWTTPAGCSPIAGQTDTTVVNTIQYECDNPGTTTPTYTCTMSPTAANMTASAWGFKNVPAGGASMVDRASVRHNASGTTCTISNISTGRFPGETAFSSCAVTAQSITFSAPSNPNILISGTDAGGMVWYLGPTAQAPGNTTMTMGTAVSTGFMLMLKSGQTSCTLCTAGDKVEVTGPATAQSEADTILDFIGAL